MGCGIWYQLKSCVRDKMCILSFLLPVIAGDCAEFSGGMWTCWIWRSRNSVW